MTKNEAMRNITRLSSGTIAHLIGSNKYERIDAAVCEWIEAVAHANENAFKNCKTWMDVLNVIK